MPINALLFQIQRVLLCSFFFFLRLNLRLVEIIIATRDWGFIFALICAVLVVGGVFQDLNQFLYLKLFILLVFSHVVQQLVILVAKLFHSDWLGIRELVLIAQFYAWVWVYPGLFVFLNCIVY